MQLPLLLDRTGRQSLTDQIVDQLRHAIVQTQLHCGARLPSSRRLAEQLEVARNTVIRAYEALTIEGLIEPRPSSGIFVASELPAASKMQPIEPTGAAARTFWSMPLPAVPSPPKARALPGRSRLSHDFAPARAHAALFPLKAWRRLLLKQLARGGAAGLTDGGDPAGQPALRSAIAAHLAASRGVVADPGRIIVTSGVQEAIGLAARLFLHRGTTAAIEDPCASSASLAFEATGSEVIGVPIDADGLVPDRLPQQPTALLYLTPSHQFPTGHLLSAQRRESVAAWARRCGCYILEDDSDGEFRYEGSPLKAIAATAPDCTIYLGAFSRTLGDGLRLGFMLVPDRLADAAIAAKGLFHGGSPWLEQAALADMMKGPSYAAHVARVRAHYRESRDCLLAALRRNFGEVNVSGEGSGLHLLWRLPPGVPDASMLELMARRRRIGVYTLASGGAAWFAPTLLERRALLLGFGSVVPRQIDQGVDLLSEIIDDTIDDPAADITEFLVRVPEAPIGPANPRNRLPKRLDSRFRRRPALPIQARERSTSRAKDYGASTAMARIVSLYRYPVKGLSAEALTSVGVEAERPVPYDRVFALARPAAPIERDDPQWAKKGLFAMLMLDEGLAQVSTHLELDDMRLNVKRNDRLVASGRLTNAEDRTALEQFFWSLLPNFPAPPIILRSRAGHFMDKPDNVISLINIATLRALEDLWRVKIDPLRFRANIYIDGAKPWEEFNWIGMEVRVGGATFTVDRKNGRCGATNVNPATGQRDLDIPSALRASFGHKNLGVYLVARRSGQIAIGDPLSTPVAPAAFAQPAQPLLSTAPRKRFICKGCYFIYDEEAGPTRSAFEALPPDWRCPDCGTEKTTFRPYVPEAVG